MAQREIPHPSGNSNNLRIQEKTEDKSDNKRVIPGKIVRKSFGKRIVEAFIPKNPKQEIENLILEVVVPSIKDAIYKTVNTTISTIIYGDSNRTVFPNAPFNNYNYGKMSRNQQRYSGVNPNRNVYEYEEVGFDEKFGAEEALAELRYRIDQYGQCCVGDLYDSIGADQSSLDRHFGWRDLSTAHSYPKTVWDSEENRYVEKWFLDLPRAIQL